MLTRQAMKTQVKICGLTRAQDVACAIENGAGFLGFIVECASKRKLSVSEAAALSLPAKGLAQRVAVTVNPDDDLLTRLMAEMAPDYVQLHGDETFARTADIARRFKVKVIKAVPVADETDMKRAAEFMGAADFVLFDAKPPKGETVRGGHGLSFDHSLLARAPLPKIWALAGGLSADNVAQAIALTKPPLVDVSSGVESTAGLKSEAKITAFMKAAHRYG